MNDEDGKEQKAASEWQKLADRRQWIEQLTLQYKEAWLNAIGQVVIEICSNPHIPEWAREAHVASALQGCTDVSARMLDKVARLQKIPERLLLERKQRIREMDAERRLYAIPYKLIAGYTNRKERTIRAAYRGSYTEATFKALELAHHKAISALHNP